MKLTGATIEDKHLDDLLKTQDLTICAHVMVARRIPSGRTARAEREEARAWCANAWNQRFGVADRAAAPAAGGRRSHASKSPRPRRGAGRTKGSASSDAAGTTSSALTREGYVERVRDALTLSRAGELPPDDYLSALREIASDLDGMIAAAEEEALSEGDPDR
jgi:hypothetical protein